MSKQPNYWLVGATWDGDDQANAFFRRGYWELGYDDQQQPAMAKQRDSIKPGDRVAVKSMRGRAQKTITIKGMGVVKEIASDKRVYYILSGSSPISTVKSLRTVASLPFMVRTRLQRIQTG